MNSQADLTAVACTSVTSCWAVGEAAALNGSTVIGYGDQTAAYQWNGTDWSTFPTPNPGGVGNDYVSALSCPSVNECWAAVQMLIAGTYNNPLLVYLLRWDGSSWSQVSVPGGGGDFSNTLDNVSCDAPDDCFATGEAGFLYLPPPYNPRPFADHWDGKAWSRTSIPVSNNGGTDFTCIISSQTCIAIGQDSSGNWRVSDWNGANWSALGTVTNMTYLMFGALMCLSTNDCWAGPDPRIESCGLSGPPVVYHLTASSEISNGYRAVAADGGVFTQGTAGFYGSMAGTKLAGPIVGSASTSDRGGYWLVGSDGGVFSFGDAAFYGSTSSLSGGMIPNFPIVGMAATPDGRGYWLVGAFGGIFPFGDAISYGSAVSLNLEAPVVAMATAPDGKGYWLVASDGGVFSFGDATFYGSIGGVRLYAPVVGMAATQDGKGYWLVASDGGVFSFGDATFYGSIGGQPPSNTPPRIVGIAVTSDGGGYLLLGSMGGVVGFGDAPVFGGVLSTCSPTFPMVALSGW